MNLYRVLYLNIIAKDAGEPSLNIEPIQSIENLFLEINKRDNLDFEPIFIGISAYDLDEDDSFDDFLEFTELAKHDLEFMKLYSIHRQKVIISSFKLLFRRLFKIG